MAPDRTADMTDIAQLVTGILAAGNVAVTKPGELSPTVSAAIFSHLKAVLDRPLD